MRGRTTRHGRTERNRWLNAEVGPRDVAVVYGAVVLVPVLLWAVTNPMVAVGVGVLVTMTYTLVRVGTRVVRELLRVRAA
ncbi:hypothetical protein [Halococcus sediminicola]|uniref:hypothetical protein n=1 Tax=Halococcus sediminicola TaxID=1264579 RepID=UPI0006796653|nr:hypothetical protein [Halococcus sediminicola]